MHLSSHPSPPPYKNDIRHGHPRHSACQHLASRGRPSLFQCEHALQQARLPAPPGLPEQSVLHRKRGEGGQWSGTRQGLARRWCTDLCDALPRASLPLLANSPPAILQPLQYRDVGSRCSNLHYCRSAPTATETENLRALTPIGSARQRVRRAKPKTTKARLDALI